MPLGGNLIPGHDIEPPDMPGFCGDMPILAREPLSAVHFPDLGKSWEIKSMNAKGFLQAAVIAINRDQLS